MFLVQPVNHPISAHKKEIDGTLRDLALELLLLFNNNIKKISEVLRGSSHIKIQQYMGNIIHFCG